MVTGTEMKALKTVGKEDGKTSTRGVSRQLGIDPAYARILCMNLAKGGYLNQESHGHFQITMKGQKALGWNRDAGRVLSPAGGSGKVEAEEFHWRSISVACVGKRVSTGVVFKPGQEEAGWNTICVGNTKTVKRRQ